MSKKAGFYWLLHHDRIIEWCYDLQERIDYIKKRKPANEIETRLKWMKPVKGKLPKAVIEAGKACDKVYRKAEKAYDNVRRAHGKQAYDKAGEAYTKAAEVRIKAEVACREALQDHKDEIEALHAKEQPGCPWNGSTLIFPKGRFYC